jgi:hypothetical protein
LTKQYISIQASGDNEIPESSFIPVLFHTMPPTVFMRVYSSCGTGINFPLEKKYTPQESGLGIFSSAETGLATIPIIKQIRLTKIIFRISKPPT